MSSKIYTTTTTDTDTVAGQDQAVVLGAGAVLHSVDSAGVEASFRFAEAAASRSGASFADMVGATEATAKMAMGAMQSTAKDSVRVLSSGFGASLESVSDAYADAGEIFGASLDSVSSAYADAAQPAFDLEAVSTKMVPVFVAGFLTLGVIAWAASRKGSK